MTEHAPFPFVPGPVKLRAEDFFALGDAGALSDYPKTELIDGAIIALSPQHSRHGRIQRAIFRALDAECQRIGSLEAAFEISVVLGPHNVVQPDVMVLSSLPERGPIPAASVRLAVAVADTTLHEDLEKASRYAAGGVPEYWVADAERGVVHRVWAPGPDGYARRDQVAFGDRLESATMAGLAIVTGGLA